MLMLALAGAAALNAVPVPTDAQRAAAMDAGRAGRLIYEYDGAAWVSTDAMLAAIKDPATVGMRGYIVESDGADQEAIYYGIKDALPFKIFVARVHDGKLLSSEVVKPGKSNAMTPIEKRMIDARDAVLNREAMIAAKITPCSKESFNTVVLPPSDPDGLVRVYVLTPQPSSGAIPFGGHYRFDVDARNRVVASRPFAKSCAVLPEPTAASPGKPVSLFITHLLDDQPTEIHVWQSLFRKMPVYVGIGSNRQIWVADGDKVRPVGIIPEAAAPGA